MGIFGGGEKYSKGAYEDAVKTKSNAEHHADRMVNLIPGMEDIRAAILKDAEKAKQRIEMLHGKGQAEAIALNEEYDRLVTQAQDAVKAVEEFEKERLGMSGEN